MPPTRSSREASEGDGSRVRFGVFLPISGRAPTTVLADAALRAEALGFDWVTSKPVEQTPDRLMGDPEQLVVALRGFEKIGVQHIALQFMVPHWPERQEQIERFARHVFPAFQRISRS